MHKGVWLAATVVCALHGSPAVASEPSDKVEGYFKCVENSALALGKGNKEPAETILRAAYAECKGDQSIAVLSLAVRDAEAGVFSGRATADSNEARLRELAGDRAIAALLKARAGK